MTPPIEYTFSHIHIVVWIATGVRERTHEVACWDDCVIANTTLIGEIWPNYTVNRSR